jgi:erythromycin esterase-like protein
MLEGLLGALALLAAAPAARPVDAHSAALDAAVRDLCHRDVAMLGEASHGDGATFAFKAALIRRLVSQCGYNAVFFESSHYDFLELDRRLRAREQATPAMLSSAIGGVWNRYAELTELTRFLFERAREGRLTLGGLDDQLGSAGAFFSIDEMPSRLAGRLEGARRIECTEALRRRIYSSYPSGNRYDEAERARIRACLAEIAAVSPDRAFTRQLIDNISRMLERDFTGAAAMTRGRDRSMYLNLRWLAARLGPRAKIIVWAHNVHIARDATASPAFADGGSLGSYVHRAYGRRAFALGFSAYAGAWRRPPFMREDQALAAAPAGSLEARAFAPGDRGAAYRGHAWLARLGRVPGRPFNYEFAQADWSRAFDGMVVFGAERAPLLAD